MRTRKLIVRNVHAITCCARIIHVRESEWNYAYLSTRMYAVKYMVIATSSCVHGDPCNHHRGISTLVLFIFDYKKSEKQSTCMYISLQPRGSLMLLHWLMIKPRILEFCPEFRAEFIHVFTSLRRAVVLAGWVFAVVCWTYQWTTAPF